MLSTLHERSINGYPKINYRFNVSRLSILGDGLRGWFKASRRIHLQRTARHCFRAIFPADMPTICYTTSYHQSNNEYSITLHADHLLLIGAASAEPVKLSTQPPSSIQVSHVSDIQYYLSGELDGVNFEDTSAGRTHFSGHFLRRFRAVRLPQRVTAFPAFTVIVCHSSRYRQSLRPFHRRRWPATPPFM